jgi:kynurenine formamidase
VAAAAALIQTGTIVSLAGPFGPDGPQDGTNGRFNPLHYMTILPTDPAAQFPGEIGAADDVVVMPLQVSTQWDSLAHISHRGRIYGNRPATLVSASGAAVNSITAINDRIATRGVLIDLPSVLGVDALEPGHQVTPALCEKALERSSISADEGDVLLVRTGFYERCRLNGWAGWHGEAPGLGVDMLGWLHDHRVAAVATDTKGVECKPSPLPGISIPFHAIAIVYMGLLLGEIFNLEHLSRHCAATGVYEFFFVAPPLPVACAVGSPINPYAIF